MRNQCRRIDKENCIRFSSLRSPGTSFHLFPLHSSSSLSVACISTRQGSFPFSRRFLPRLTSDQPPRNFVSCCAGPFQRHNDAHIDQSARKLRTREFFFPFSFVLKVPSKFWDKCVSRFKTQYGGEIQ